MFLHVRPDAIRCSPLSPSAPHGKSYGYWKTLENHWKASFLHVWQKHFQRVRMVCPVRCPEELEWALPGRRRKSVNPSATMSGNDVRNSGRSARPRPPPRAAGPAWGCTGNGKKGDAWKTRNVGRFKGGRKAINSK